MSFKLFGTIIPLYVVELTLTPWHHDFLPISGLVSNQSSRISCHIIIHFSFSYIGSLVCWRTVVAWAVPGRSNRQSEYARVRTWHDSVREPTDRCAAYTSDTCSQWFVRSSRWLPWRHQDVLRQLLLQRGADYSVWAAQWHSVSDTLIINICL